MLRSWVADYMREKKQTRNDKLARAQMALAGAGGLFKMLADRVEEDIKEYHKSGGDAELRYENLWTAKFKVFKNTYPSVDLEISLTGALVECHYFFKESSADDRREQIFNIRILASESGSVQFFKNGEAYSEESEVSNVILARVFDYLDLSQ